jgi:hypothetical protein
MRKTIATIPSRGVHLNQEVGERSNLVSYNKPRELRRINSSEDVHASSLSLTLTFHCSKSFEMPLLEP